MKRILLSVRGLLALSALIAVAAAGKDDKVEQAIMKLERQWMDASIKADAAAIDKIEAEDYIMIDPTGSISTKEEDMKNVKSGDLKFDSMEILQSKVRVYGDTAVITGKSHIKGNYKGQDIGGDYSFTDVFVKKGADWKAVSSHITRVAQ
jgi:ketosteroid isomerase-like protein